MPEADVAKGAASSELGLGERLRSARKARALSLEQVAESLHLDEKVILALEDERYEAFGAPVFVRGHLRAYARLVGLPVDSVLEAYRVSDPATDGAPVVTREKMERVVSLNPVLSTFGVLVALVGFALAYYLLNGDDPAPAAIAPPPEAAVLPKEKFNIFQKVTPVPNMNEAPAGAGAAPEAGIPGAADPVDEKDEPPATAEVRGDDDSADRPGEPIDVPAMAAPELVAVPPAATPEVPAVPQGAESVQLGLSFLQESWVEVYDANGRLLFGLEREGMRRTLNGEPPFRFVFGNGGGIELRVNDERYAFPVARPGRVTRFEISSEMIDP